MDTVSMQKPIIWHSLIRFRQLFWSIFLPMPDRSCSYSMRKRLWIQRRCRQISRIRWPVSWVVLPMNWPVRSAVLWEKSWSRLVQIFRNPWEMPWHPSWVICRIFFPLIRMPLQRQFRWICRRMIYRSWWHPLWQPARFLMKVIWIKWDMLTRMTRRRFPFIRLISTVNRW